MTVVTWPPCLSRVPEVGRSLVVPGAGYCWSAALLFGLSLACAAAYAQDRPAGESALGPAWPAAPGYPSGYRPVYQDRGNAPGDLAYDQVRYRGQYPVTTRPMSVAPASRGSAPWHRLLEPPPLAPGWSSAPGPVYPASPSSSAPRPAVNTPMSYYGSAQGRGRYDPSQQAPGGFRAGFSQPAGIEPARAYQARSYRGLANAPIIDYNDYTSIPEKPPSGMPKPGVDSIDVSGE